MRGRWSKRDRTVADRGAAAVEFALVAPLLFMVLFGIIEFGLVLNQKQGIHSAAREGARVLSLPTTTRASACQRVNQALTGIDGTFTITVKKDGAPAGSCPGGTDKPCNDPSIDAVTVTVSTPYDISVPGFDEAGTIKGEAVFQCEH